MKLLKNWFAKKPKGPYEHELIAIGCPYTGVAGLTFIWSTPGTSGHVKSVQLEAVVSPVSPSVTVVGNTVKVKYRVNETSYKQIIDMVATAAVNVVADCVEWKYDKVVPAASPSAFTFANGSATPHVGHLELFYTADGRVKIQTIY